MIRSIPSFSDELIAPLFNEKEICLSLTHFNATTKINNTEIHLLSLLTFPETHLPKIVILLKETYQLDCVQIQRLPQINLSTVPYAYLLTIHAPLKTSLTDELLTSLHTTLKAETFCSDFLWLPKELPSIKLIAFDMDSTFIQQEVIDEIARIANVEKKVAHITELAMEGQIPFDESFRQRAKCLTGLSTDVLETVNAYLSTSPGIPTTIDYLKKNNIKVGIISGGIYQMAQQLKEQFQLDFIFSNELYFENNLLSGQVKEPILNAQQKALFLNTICEKYDISLENTMAIGDGANDLPMLKASKIGIAFHGKNIVNKNTFYQIHHFGMDVIIYLIEALSIVREVRS